MYKSLMGIISDPAALHFIGCPSQRRSSVSGQTNIDGFSLDVVAVFRGTFAVFAQLGIGFRAAVSGDHLERLSRFEFY